MSASEQDSTATAFSGTYSDTSEYTKSEAPEVSHPARVDIVSFLAVASALSIDIIPYTWLAHLDSLGEGASSAIRQSIASLTTSFAFKPFKRRPLELSPTQKAFEEATSEIQILGISRIREHPNIARLEGVCWSVSSEGDVLPVIVSEKTHLGSLSTFMQQNQTDVDVGSMHLRWNLATDIVDGLSELHSCRKFDIYLASLALSRRRDHTRGSKARKHSCLYTNGQFTEGEDYRLWSLNLVY
jgi:hypothetical protein